LFVSISRVSKSDGQFSVSMKLALKNVESSIIINILFLNFRLGFLSQVQIHRVTCVNII
jgi:hypothetical protein